MGLSPSWVNLNTIQLVFVASMLRMQHKGIRTKARNQDNMYEWSDMSTRKTGRLGIRIICKSGATCLQERQVG